MASRLIRNFGQQIRRNAHFISLRVTNGEQNLVNLDLIEYVKFNDSTIKFYRINAGIFDVESFECKFESRESAVKSYDAVKKYLEERKILLDDEYSNNYKK
jgi:hypothetical protein